MEPSDDRDALAAKRTAELEHIYDGETYDDWFLPSAESLSLIYDNLHTAGLGEL